MNKDYPIDYICPYCGEVAFSCNRIMLCGEIVKSANFILPTGEHPVVGDVSRCLNCGGTVPFSSTLKIKDNRCQQ